MLTGNNLIIECRNSSCVHVRYYNTTTDTSEDMTISTSIILKWRSNTERYKSVEKSYMSNEYPHPVSSIPYQCHHCKQWECHSPDGGVRTTLYCTVQLVYTLPHITWYNMLYKNFTLIPPAPPPGYFEITTEHWATPRKEKDRGRMMLTSKSWKSLTEGIPGCLPTVELVEGSVCVGPRWWTHRELQVSWGVRCELWGVRWPVRW